jgi:hypothetical protein
VSSGATIEFICIIANTAWQATTSIGQVRIV